MIQYYLRTLRPTLLGLFTKIIYLGSNVKFGKRLKCDSIPKILIDKKCFLNLGNDLILRRNVELRIHGKSSIEIKNNVKLDRGVRILSANDSKIIIENNVKIGLYTVINGGDNVHIGDNTLISGFVYLQTSMHNFNNKEKTVQNQGFRHAGIVLDKNVWLGTHCVIMPGVNIKEGSVIGSNAVVTKSVSEYKIMVGIPAREIKSI